MKEGEDGVGLFVVNVSSCLDRQFIDAWRPALFTSPQIFALFYAGLFH